MHDSICKIDFIIFSFIFIYLFPVYENREKIVLVMEYASGGELYEYINTKGAVDGLPDHEARKFFRQIVSAVYYLHQVSS